MDRIEIRIYDRELRKEVILTPFAYDVEIIINKFIILNHTKFSHISDYYSYKYLIQSLEDEIKELECRIHYLETDTDDN